MSKRDGIKLSPKYGINPTIPLCFWCGQEKNEIALMDHIGDGRKGEDIEAPIKGVLKPDAVKRIFNLDLENGKKLLVSEEAFSAIFTSPIMDENKN